MISLFFISSEHSQLISIVNQLYVETSANWIARYYLIRFTPIHCVFLKRPIQDINYYCIFKKPIVSGLFAGTFILVLETFSLQKNVTCFWALAYFLLIFELTHSVNLHILLHFFKTLMFLWCFLQKIFKKGKCLLSSTQKKNINQ